MAVTSSTRYLSCQTGIAVTIGCPTWFSPRCEAVVTSGSTGERLTVHSYNPYFVAIIATVGGMLFGFDISSMSAIIGTKQYNDFFDKPAGLRQGAIGSALAAGSVVGSAIAGPVSNAIGRRNSLFFACAWWLTGTAVQTSVNGFGMLIAGRVLNGVCVGITSSQVPVYIAEIAKKEKRGALIIIQQLAIEWGILIMYFIGCTSPPLLSFEAIAQLIYFLRRMQLYSRSIVFPDRVGHSICPLCMLSDRSALPPRVTALACEEGPHGGGDSNSREDPGKR